MFDYASEKRFSYFQKKKKKNGEIKASFKILKSILEFCF